MRVGEKIKAERKKSGLTQKQLGERLNVTGVTVGQWETGKRKPKTETLLKIASALKIDPNLLTGKTIYTLRRDGSIEGYTSKEYEDVTNKYYLINRYEGLNQNGKTKLIEYADMLFQIDQYKKDSYLYDESFQDQWEAMMRGELNESQVIDLLKTAGYEPDDIQFSNNPPENKLNSNNDEYENPTDPDGQDED